MGQDTPNKNKTFSELWEESELSQKQSVDKATTFSILDEIVLKINLLKSVLEKEFPEDQKIKIKNQLMGEIIYTLTGLTLKEDVNIYSALRTTLHLKKNEIKK